MRSLRVGIDARLVPGQSGGIEQFVTGLAGGLAQLGDGNEEYLFLTWADHSEWLRPHLGGRCRLLVGKSRAPRGQWELALKAAPSVAAYAGNRLAKAMGATLEYLPNSDGTIEAAGVQLMHLCKQFGFRTQVPSIYHPHDLQHLHLPQYFSPAARLLREIYYPALCRRAAVVAVANSWTKADLLAHYNLQPDKVSVVPLAPALDGTAPPTPQALEATRKKYSLPERFAFYPAQTWEHKNHLTLLEALKRLETEHGLEIPLVCSGRRTDFFPRIETRLRELGLTSRVRFLDFVSAAELGCLYRLCTCVVIPTKFEAGSFPLWEAFLHGTPAACSNVTSLPAQAGDAALTFDPNQATEIATALHRLWNDTSLRRQLAERGARRVSVFTWRRTARHFRALYRRTAMATLDSEDIAVLEAPPLL